jgi:hypothetical protein
MRNTVATAYTTVPTVVTVASGHVRRNQRSRCRNPFGHVHRNIGHVGPEYSTTIGAPPMSANGLFGKREEGRDEDSEAHARA